VESLVRLWGVPPVFSPILAPLWG